MPATPLAVTVPGVAHPDWIGTETGCFEDPPPFLHKELQTAPAPAPAPRPPPFSTCSACGCRTCPVHTVHTGRVHTQGGKTLHPTFPALSTRVACPHRCTCPPQPPTHCSPFLTPPPPPRPPTPLPFCLTDDPRAVPSSAAQGHWHRQGLLVSLRTVPDVVFVLSAVVERAAPSACSRERCCSKGEARVAASRDRLA